jgi:hypothetical protein
MVRSRFGIVFAAVGVVLVIFGIVWMTAIFSIFEKVPSDYERIYTFDGEYRLPDPQNPLSGQLISIPVIMTRTLEAAGAGNGAMFISEQISTVNLAGGPIDPSNPERFNQQSTLAIDRATRKNVDVSADYPSIPVRKEQWSPPGHLKEGENFLMWSPAANIAIEVKYIDKEEFRGMTVFSYEAIGNDILLGPDPNYGFDIYVDTQLNLKCEPLSGVPIAQNSIVTRSFGDVPQIGKLPFYQSVITYSEESIDYLTDLAKDSRTKIQWFGTYMPWMIIGLGAVLIIVSVAIMLRKGVQPA